MSRTGDDSTGYRPATRLVRSRRDRDIVGPFVNPPLVHASTVRFDSVATATALRV